MGDDGGWERGGRRILFIQGTWGVINIGGIVVGCL